VRHSKIAGATSAPGQPRPFADVASMPGLPSEAAVEPTSMDGREVPIGDIRPECRGAAGDRLYIANRQIDEKYGAMPASCSILLP
jgi:hypothetical protein